MATGTATVLTLEEFAALPNEGARHEIDRGELITMAPVQFVHTRIQHILLDSLRPVVKDRKLGEAFLEPGCLLAEDPPTLREPDVAFLSNEALQREPAAGFFPGAPTIAIEVVSPSETAADLETKIRQYLAAGCQAVAVVYPRSRSVLVHRPGADPHRLEAGDVLSFPDILGDWSLSLAEIFPSQA